MSVIMFMVECKFDKQSSCKFFAGDEEIKDGIQAYVDNIVDYSKRGDSPLEQINFVLTGVCFTLESPFLVPEDMEKEILEILQK